MLILPDANAEFLMGLQQALIDEAQAPLRAQADAAMMQAAPSGNAAPPGAPMMAPGGAPPGLAQLLGVGGPGGGSAPLPPAPAADELRRMTA
jgi:hypothetical protein